MISRREFLSALAALGLTLRADRLHALGPRDKLALGELELSGANTHPHPTALRRLLWEVDKRTSIDVRFEPVPVKLGDADLFRLPFLYLAGMGTFPLPADEDVARLRRHLQAGGFLLADSADGRAGRGGFDGALRNLVERLFPDEPLTRLPDDHVIYQSFYLVKGATGRVVVSPRLEAVTHDGRAAIVYSSNDLGGAWARDSLGEWEHDVRPGGEQQREMSFRLGVNLVMYATCLDYKTDQVHVPFILHRRRWQAR